MGKWFQQAAEIERLQAEVKRQALMLEQLAAQRSPEHGTVNVYGVSAQETALVAEGKPIPAIKAYRERTGADLLTAKKAIDSVLQ